MGIMKRTGLLRIGCAIAMLAAVMGMRGLAEKQAMRRDNPGANKDRFIDTHVHFHDGKLRREMKKERS